ncbi:MAG: hypothetical protein ABTR92_06985 [Candidatus Accumulibacter phosphatis]|nr:hypothetical protein [Candidatus Accumulibacter sp. ACC012]
MARSLGESATVATSRTSSVATRARQDDGVAADELFGNVADVACLARQVI